MSTAVHSQTPAFELGEELWGANFEATITWDDLPRLRRKLGVGTGIIPAPGTAPRVTISSYLGYDGHGDAWLIVWALGPEAWRVSICGDTPNAEPKPEWVELAENIVRAVRGEIINTTADAA